MNKLERAYGLHLDALQRSGDIRRWRFESLVLVLADDTRYRPDFLVERWEGPAEIHEVKGYWRDDARVKFRVAAEQYPMFEFSVVYRRGGLWVTESLRAGWRPGAD